MLGIAKKKTSVENGMAGVDPALAAIMANGDDLGPIVRHSFQAGRPDALLSQLQIIEKKKEVEIEELCKLHYEEFILAVNELRGVLVDAEDLKGVLSSEILRLQEVGTALLVKIDELLELYLIKKNVTEALQMMKVCIQVLRLCMVCNKLIRDHQFYSLLKTIDLIEKEYLNDIPVKALQKVIRKHIPIMKQHMEKKVCSGFDDWLTYIRSSSREIGQQAIGQAASARLSDQEMITRHREAEEQSHSGAIDCAYTLDLDHFEEDSVIDFDLTPVYRAIHIHFYLGMREKFRDYYYSKRLLQLDMDLQTSAAEAFLESHQAFFANIAGFFIVEDRILRTAGDLLTESQVDSLWAKAMSMMTAVLENHFPHIDTASHLLLVKDFVTLFCAAMSQYGYQVTPLYEVLDNSSDKYHELLMSECSKQISDFISGDTFERMVIKKEHDYNMNLVAFHLQSSDLLPDFPYIAQFSSCVPDACRMVRSFIEDSVSYLSYGGRMNFYDVVKKYLDKLLVEVLNKGLLNTIHAGNLGVPPTMQLAANIAILEHSCDYFLWQAGQSCRLPVRFVEGSDDELTARAVLRTSQNVAYNKLQNLINSKLDEFLSLMSNLNWTADEAPEHVNDYMNEILIYLDSVISSAQQILPLDAIYSIGAGSLHHISESIVAAFLNENLKRFNLNSVLGIDNDLKTLESFADKRFEITGLSDLGKDKNFRDCLVESRQLVNLLMSNQPEAFMIPAVREQNYSSLDHKKVAIICEKCKDSPDNLFSSLSSRSTQQSARKKSMDVLKKRLKDFS